MKLCTKYEGNRAIRGGVIAISVFDLMTLNVFHVLSYVFVIFLCWYLILRCDLDRWPWTL